MKCYIQVLDNFLENITIFQSKCWERRFFRLIVENMSSPQARNGNGVMAVNCSTLNIQFSKAVFQTCIINLFGLMGRHTNHINNILIESAVLAYFMSILLEASCYTNHHLVVADRRDYQQVKRFSRLVWTNSRSES